MIHQNWFVQLVSQNPFYHLFPSGFAPIKDWRPEIRTCGSNTPEPTYLLDWDRCSIEQKKEIAAICAKLFDTTGKEAFEEIEKRGMPIRMAQTFALPRGGK